MNHTTILIKNLKIEKNVIKVENHTTLLIYILQCTVNYSCFTWERLPIATQPHDAKNTKWRFPLNIYNKNQMQTDSLTGNLKQ